MPTAINPVEIAARPRDKKPWALRALPPLPGVAMQVLGLLDNPDTPIKKVADLLRMDPALSAELLRVANSALYGFVQRIDNVNHALVVLGAESVKRLALTVALNKFAQGFLRYESLKVCWDHSLACAVICEELAPSLNLRRERAYTAGLLHDVGRLALLVCYPIEYGNLLLVAREEKFDQLECERQLFDIDHCAAGQWLAEHWDLPAAFSQAIALHHAGDATEGEDAELVDLVRCACRLADCAGYNVLQAPSGEKPADVLAGLPLQNLAQAVSGLEGIEDRIQRAVMAFGPAARGRE